MICYNYFGDKMKRKVIILCIALIVPIIYWIIDSNRNHFIDNKVSDYGELSIKDGKLVDKNGEIAHLRGLSSHGVYWFGDYYTYDNLKTLVDTWNMNVFRIAVYTNPDDDGYVKYPEVMDKVYQIIDNCIKLDIYVVVDWHILNDNNPNTYKEYAIKFFDEISLKYKDKPNLLYEICNEPNGEDVTWNNDIKPYAEELIPVIRKNSPNSLILVGTSDWSKGIEEVSYNLINDDKVMYVLHGYPNGGMDIVRRGIELSSENKIPIIITETAATDSTGDGELFIDYFKDCLDFFENNNVSWIVWNLSEKRENSSIVVPEEIRWETWIREKKKTQEEIDKEEYDLNNYLSEHGQLIKELFIKYNKK